MTDCWNSLMTLSFSQDEAWPSDKKTVAFSVWLPLVPTEPYWQQTMTNCASNMPRIFSFLPLQWAVLSASFTYHLFVYPVNLLIPSPRLTLLLLQSQAWVLSASTMWKSSVFSVLYSYLFTFSFPSFPKASYNNLIACLSTLLNCSLLRNNDSIFLTVLSVLGT